SAVDDVALDNRTLSIRIQLDAVAGRVPDVVARDSRSIATADVDAVVERVSTRRATVVDPVVIDPSSMRDGISVLDIPVENARTAVVLIGDVVVIEPNAVGMDLHRRHVVAPARAVDRQSGDAPVIRTRLPVDRAADSRRSAREGTERDRP